MAEQREPSRLVWLVNRLRCMSVAEVRYRLQQSGILSRTKRSLSLTAATFQPDLVRTRYAVVTRPTGIDAAPYILEANAILEGNVLLFEERQVNVGRIPDWNRNPPDSMDTLAGVTPDIKYVWELNRHLQWVRLAQAYVLSGDDRFRHGLAQQMGSWLEQCPPLTKPNWSSSMELAVRLCNWSVVWQLLGGWDGVLFKDAGGDRLRSRWLDSIFAHCQCISRNFSRYSSANNHLIGELAGLYVAARTWQFGAQSVAWAEAAKAELEREAVMQHFRDGVNREQAFAYQGFACECLTIAGIYGQRSGDPFSGEYWHTLRRAYRFLRSMRDVGGNFPMVGDADDGAVLRLEPRTGLLRLDTVLALGNALFGSATDERANDSVLWLLGSAGTLLPVHVREPKCEWKFSEGGYFFFGSRFGERDEIKGFVDCGSLGYLGIAAHGHSDALSIGLSITGQACLIDSGTFAYGDDYKWRQYFRGTSAHNTVRVDGQDQSVSGGRFMWTRKATSRVDIAPISSTQFDFAGSHEGYLRLRDPVRHIRSIVYDGAQTALLVRDTISGKEKHDIEQFWHFAPDIKVELITNVVVARGKRFELQMRLSGGDLALELIFGQEHPPLGWFSRGYGTKQPTTVLRVRASAVNVSIEAQFAIRLFD